MPALARLASTVTMPPGLVTNTPLLESAPLSALAGTRVLLKLDATQPSGSFKDRGMAYMCARLQQSGAKSLICSSGGNAGHAVAVMGRMLGMRVSVIVPTVRPTSVLGPRGPCCSVGRGHRARAPIAC